MGHLLFILYVCLLLLSLIFVYIEGDPRHTRQPFRVSALLDGRVDGARRVDLSSCLVLEDTAACHDVWKLSLLQLFLYSELL